MNSHNHSQQATPQLYRIGNMTVRVEDNAFQHGFEQGYATFCQRHSGTQTSDWRLSGLFLGMMWPPYRSGRYKAGYLLGWMAACYDTAPSLEATDEAWQEAPPNVIVFPTKHRRA